MLDINFDKIDEFISSKGGDTTTEIETVKGADGKVEKVTERTYPTPNEVNVVRYEFMMRMLDAVLAYLDEADQALGVNNAIDTAPLTIQTYYDILIDKGIILED